MPTAALRGGLVGAYCALEARTACGRVFFRSNVGVHQQCVHAITCFSRRAMPRRELSSWCIGVHTPHGFFLTDESCFRLHQVYLFNLKKKTGVAYSKVIPQPPPSVRPAAPPPLPSLPPDDRPVPEFLLELSPTPTEKKRSSAYSV